MLHSIVLISFAPINSIIPKSMKIRHLIVLSFIALFIGISSCREDFDYDMASQELRFSNDTLNLDTIFNFTRSQTYRLSIHNRQNKDVFVPKIYLNKGENSYFKINVDGMPGHSFDQVAIRKKDSIIVFVEIAAQEAPSNPNYQDEIVVETEAGFQQIKLLSFIEKAKFYNVDLDENYQMTENNWDQTYSRVLFGNVNADQLTIGPNTKVYLHSDANLTIHGALNIQGSLQNEVIFRTDRMDERSDSLPNNWGKIKIKTPQNVENSIQYAVIRGGNVGLEVNHSNLTINNSKIFNNEMVGLHGINSKIRANNMLISNSNLAALAIEGGNVEFIHSTFANYFNIGQGVGGNYSLFLGNLGENDIDYPLVQANFYNCIIYGRSANAIYFDQGNSSFNHDFKNNVIRMIYPDELSGIDSSNILNEDPKYVNPGFGKNDLRLKDDSPILGLANPIYANMVPLDILNQPRTSAPTAGAYQNAVASE